MKSKKKNGKARQEEQEPESGKERLNLLIDADLKRWAHRFAKKRCTSITALVTNHLVELREREKSVDVEQI